MPRGRLLGREDLWPHQKKGLLSFSSLANMRNGLQTPNLLLVLVASFTESSAPMAQVAKGTLLRGVAYVHVVVERFVAGSTSVV